MFQTKVVQKIKTHILCSILFSPQKRAVCEKMWKKSGTARQVIDDSTVGRRNDANSMQDNNGKTTETHDGE